MKNSIKVVFMGTPEFSVPILDVLADAFSVVGVYTQPDKAVGRGLEFKPSPVKKKALELNIPVFQPEKLAMPGEFERLKELHADVIVVAAYGQILKKNVLELPPLGCINVHSSLLPRWRGAAPIHWALMSGDLETGITTMFMAEKLDAGDILLQESTPISSEDTITDVHDRLAQMGAKLILPTIEGLKNGTLKGQAQNEAAVTYATKLSKEMEWLNPEESAEVLARKIRALNPWPGTSVRLGGRLKIKQARPHKNIQGSTGQIFEKVGMLLLGTSQGSLELLVLQWEGKKEVDAAGFLNGLKGKGLSLPLTVQTL